MKLTFIGSFYPKNRYQEILNRSKYIDFAGNTLQWSLIQGFDSLSVDLNAITVPTTKKLSGCIFKSSIFNINQNLKNYCVGFFDIIGLKQLFSSFSVLKNIKRLNRPNHLLIYSIQVNLLAAAFIYKKISPNTKITLLVTDLSEYMNDTANIVYKIFKKIEITINNYLFMPSVDCFILLTENMKEKLPIKDKPYLVMEGIYNPLKIKEQKLNKSNSNIKIILYSGTLAKRYGIMNLVYAFLSIKKEDYRLVICGDGDSKEEIIKATNLDNRIIYMGVIEREKVLKLQQESSLLVNPRLPEGEYTKYSFPSKIIEYLASGTPTLMYKLSGVPIEYYNYCFTVNKIGIKPLADSIEYILSKSSEELNSFGEKAKEFIIKTKNPTAQCSKIINMMRRL